MNSVMIIHIINNDNYSQLTLIHYFSVSNPGARMEVTEDGKRLSIHELCKDCGVGETDLRVIQCNVSNTHGYVFADAYLNVLRKCMVEIPILWLCSIHVSVSEI